MLTNTRKDPQHCSLLEKCKSKLQWDIISHQSEWPSPESLQTVNAGEGVEKRECSCTVCGNANWYSHYGRWFESEVKVKVPQSYPVVSMDYIVHEILQARILEWVAFPFSGGSSPPRDRTRSPALQADSLAAKPQRKTVWRLLKKLRIKPPYDPAIPLLGIYPEETKI